MTFFTPIDNLARKYSALYFNPTVSLSQDSLWLGTSWLDSSIKWWINDWKWTLAAPKWRIFFISFLLNSASKSTDTYTINLDWIRSFLFSNRWNLTVETIPRYFLCIGELETSFESNYGLSSAWASYLREWGSRVLTGITGVAKPYISSFHKPIYDLRFVRIKYIIDKRPFQVARVPAQRACRLWHFLNIV